MSNTAKQAKEAILKHGGRARKQEIARDLKISLEYASLICKELKLKGEINLSNGFYFLTSLRKDATENKGQEEAVSTPAIIKRSDRKFKKLRGIRAKKTKKIKTKKNDDLPLSNILGINKELAQTLDKAGYNTIESLAEAPISMLMQRTQLKLQTAAHLINQARKIR